MKFKSILFLSLLSFAALSTIIFAQDRTVWVGLLIGLIGLVFINFIKLKGAKKAKFIMYVLVFLGLLITLFVLILPKILPFYNDIYRILTNRFTSIFEMQRDFAYRERSRIREEAMYYFKQNPILGSGYLKWTGHDFFSQLLTYNGIVGLLIWIFIFGFSLYNMAYTIVNIKWVKNPRLRSFIVSQSAMFPAFIAMCWVSPYLYGEFDSMLLFNFIVASFIILRKEISERKIEYEKK